MKITFPLLTMFCSMTFAHTPLPQNRLTLLDPSIKTDLVYATAHNFTGKAVYPSSARAYLVTPAAAALLDAQKEFEKIGYQLLVWDAYRPWSVQKIFWDIVHDERYVLSPEKTSRHNRGCAVDVTLLTLSGDALEMPTPFDEFTERAHRDYENLSDSAKKNRALLEEVMVRHGFIGLPTEWWHFDFIGFEQFPALDIDFDTLATVS